RTPVGGGAPGEGGEVGRAFVPDDVLAVDLGAGGELLGEAGHDGVDDRAHLDRAAEDAGDRRHAPVADAAGDDVAEHREVGVDVEGEAVHRPALRDLHADGVDLVDGAGGGRRPHAGQPLLHAGLDAEVGQDGDQHRLEAADVADDVAE